MRTLRANLVGESRGVVEMIVVFERKWDSSWGNVKIGMSFFSLCYKFLKENGAEFEETQRHVLDYFRPSFISEIFRKIRMVKNFVKNLPEYPRKKWTNFWETPKHVISRFFFTFTLEIFEKICEAK